MVGGFLKMDIDLGQHGQAVWVGVRTPWGTPFGPLLLNLVCFVAKVQDHAHTRVFPVLQNVLFDSSGL